MLSAYAPGTGTTAYVNNGKNQLTSVGGAAVGYDARQNITSRPGASYGYNALNQMTSANPGAAATLTCDPAGRFQYTGQVWLPEAQVYHYRARAYAPGLGRFLQTDPIGYAAGANLYSYVGADPVNWIDPTGTEMREFPCARLVGYRISPDGKTVETFYEKDTCYVDLSISSWFENQGWRAIGRLGRDDTEPNIIACPAGPYGQLTGGASASGAAFGGGGSAGASAGVSGPLRGKGLRGFQLFFQSRAGAGYAAGGGASAGPEVGVGVQQGPLPSGVDTQISSFVEVATPYGTAAGSAGAEASAGASFDARGRAGPATGVYAISGAQTTQAISTPPFGCKR